MHAQLNYEKQSDLRSAEKRCIWRMFSILLFLTVIITQLLHFRGQTNNTHIINAIQEETHFQTQHLHTERVYCGFRYPDWPLLFLIIPVFHTLQASVLVDTRWCCRLISIPCHIDFVFIWTISQIRELCWEACLDLRRIYCWDFSILGIINWIFRIKQALNAVIQQELTQR